MFFITNVKQILKECYQITFSSGSCFFLRLTYLTSVSAKRLKINEGFSEEEMQELIDAGLAYSAERVAMSYLGRSEQCRFLLTRKLKRKGFDDSIIKVALDFLEVQGYLSDTRFAQAWLRMRSINHVEGQLRLLSELMSRGIDRNIAKVVVEEYFADIDEDVLFAKAADKCRKLGKTGVAAESYLRNKGFSMKQINSIISIL